MTSEPRTSEAPEQMFPFRQTDPCTAPGEYQRLAREEPVSRVLLPTGDAAWLVASHEHVQAVLSDERFSRQALTGPDAPRLAPVPPMPSLFYLDPPQHTRIRRLAADAFGAARIERLRPRLEQITEQHLDTLASLPRPADLLAALARPLPLAVLIAILGVPADTAERFAGWTRTVLNFAAEPDAQQAAAGALHGYLVGLIQARRDEPGDDVLTDLVSAVHGDDRLRDDEVLALVFDLLGAGDQPVTAEIVHAVLNLLRDPGAVRRLHDDPGLVPTATEELLRGSQSAGGGLGSVRIATAEVELAGVHIAAGDPVIPSLNAANMDESVFPASERLDLARSPNPQLAFAPGLHHCIGVEIGRIELRSVIGGLTRRFPGLRLAIAEQDLAWLPVPVFGTPAELPVDW